MDYQQEIQKLEAKQAAEREQLEREHRVRKLLPQDAVPRQVFTGTKLYGVIASVKYGSDFQAYSFREDPSYKQRTLREALDLLESIGEIVPFFSVKDGSLALKPEDQITPAEADRAEIHGPYAVKIDHGQGDGAKLEAFVKLPTGERIDVEIQLSEAHRFGSWRRTGGNDHYSESWTFEVVSAQLGQARLVRYASGSHSGPRSGSRQVYVFTFASDLDSLADAIDKDIADREAARKAREVSDGNVQDR